MLVSNSRGDLIRGALIGAGTVGIVLANQVDTDLCDWLPFATVLADRGYRVLAFDYSDLFYADLDMLAAVAELRHLGITGVVLIGASLGGTASIVAASRLNPPANLVISISAPGSYARIDAEKAAPGLRGPVWFVAGADERGFPEEARALAGLAAGADAHVQLLPTAQHGVHLFSSTATTLSAQELCFQLLARYAPP